MKKGFTLIEVLGVIVILSIILVIAMPNIINTIKNTNKKLDIYSANMIYKAADNYILHSNLFEEKKGNTYCIKIDKLVYEGLLESPVRYDEKDDIKDTMSVKATYSNKWNYSIVNNTECSAISVKICDRVTTATNGFVPEGNFDLGDEYICKLNNNLQYHFYILNVTNDKVALIAENNLDNSGEITGIDQDKWSSSQYNLNGPVDAYSYIETNIINWNNIPTIKSFDFVDGNKNCNTCGYKGIYTRKVNNDYITTISSNSNTTTYSNIKARLPMLNEINKAITGNTFPLWLKGNYYLNDSYDNTSNSAYYVTSEGTITSKLVNADGGIRPVIELHKYDLE